ncbi:Retrovirus-related Pol polyprotein from transposon [Armadillidium vulgare]|nr:Retrovirus-related Pol polyprotein from transposon [Armadillidium vulgare]
MQELSLNSENDSPLMEKDKPSFIATIEQTRDIPAGSRNLFEVTLSDMGKKSPREAIFAKKDYPSARLARWSLVVSDFCPRFEYIKGKKNQVADFLSRYIPEDKEDIRDVESEGSEEDIDHIKHESLRSRPVALSLDAQIISKAQKTCPKLEFLYKELDKGKHISGYRMFKGMIFIKQGANFKVYIPESLIETAIMLAHAAYESGHTGVERTLKRLKRRFYFKTMRKMVEEYCQQCHVCQSVKGNNPARARLGRYPLAETPFEKVSVDVLGPLPRTNQGHIYILAFKCQITKYVELVALKYRDSTTMVRYLIERVIVNHTCPETLLSDNAGEFKGTVMKEVCKKFGIKKVEIAVRTPHANSNVERLNKDIENYLRCYVRDNQKGLGSVPAFSASHY